MFSKADKNRTRAAGAAPEFGEARLGSLHRQYSGALRCYFLKRAPAQADADDLVQDVFIRLARRGDVESIAQIEGYLFQTAANVLTDQARRNAVRCREAHDSYDDAEHGGEAVSPERVLLGRERVLQLLDALDTLPQRTRAIFVLHKFEGFRYAEIAVRFSVSVSSIEKHMMKALSQIARHMDQGHD